MRQIKSENRDTWGYQLLVDYETYAELRIARIALLRHEVIA